MRLAFLAIETEKRHLVRFLAKVGCEYFDRLILRSMFHQGRPDCDLQDLALQFAEFCEGEVAIVTSHPKWIDFMPANFFTYNKLGEEWALVPGKLDFQTMEQAIEQIEWASSYPLLWSKYGTASD